MRERGGERLVGEFVPSAKNGQVAELYPELGFKPTEDCETTWTLDLTANEIESPEFISLERVGELSEADSGS